MPDRRESHPTRRRTAAALACLIGGCAPAIAADLPRAAAGPQALFAPTNPVGVASEVPRSPLTDLVAGAPQRFATRDEARRHCPSDVVVWVRLGSNVYRLDGGPSPTESGAGAYMCQADASIEGDRPL